MVNRKGFFMIAFLIVLMLGTGRIFCEEIDFAARFEKIQYKDEEGNILPYRLLKPKNIEEQDRYPLILFLHGIG
ncbi:MAG: hypothetical protein OEZ52_17225, partial [Candidatus Aminicenantes bacterium]|nr:hypothetical protein [Candidatus Aminicenantes bacterium]